MSAPIEMSLRVDCPPAHAFEVWTRRIDLWWPRGHSLSGDPGMRVEIEPRPGGRILERTPAGREHVWGEVRAWEPPGRLVFLWHIYGSRPEGTDVEVTFAPERRPCRQARCSRLPASPPSLRAALPRYGAASAHGWSCSPRERSCGRPGRPSVQARSTSRTG